MWPCWRGLCFEVLKSTQFPVSILCLLLDEDMSSQPATASAPSLLTTATLTVIIVMDSATVSPQGKFYFSKLPWLCSFATVTEEHLRESWAVDVLNFTMLVLGETWTFGLEKRLSGLSGFSGLRYSRSLVGQRL